MSHSILSFSLGMQFMRKKGELCSSGMRRCRIAAIAAAVEGKGGGGGKDGVKIEELHSAMH